MKLGKDFLLGIVNDDTGDFEPLAFAQSCSYDINNTLVKVSSPNTGGVEHYRKKTTGWTMQHEGLIGDPTLRYTFKGQQYDFISLISRVVKSGEPLTCRWHEDDEIKQGQAIVKSYKEVASEKALAKVSIALQGTGELRDLDPNDLEGTFAWVRHTGDHDVPLLTLYAIDRTIANFSVVVRTDYHGGQDSVVGTWKALGSRTQTFNCPQGAIFSVRAVRTVEEQTIEQPGVTFSDATTLHVVLLQTDTRDKQQQLHRFVQPLWWGGYALGDMEVKNAGNVTLLTLPTTGANGSIDPVEIDPSINLLTPAVLHIDMTGDVGQTAHCCDRTASLEKTLAYYQTTNNTPGVDPYMIVGPGKVFRCNFRFWGNDNEGNELFSFDQGTLVPLSNITAPVPAVANLHFQLEGLGVDEDGPWHVTNVLTSLLDPYDVYYAYDATTQKLTLYSPNVPGNLIQGVLLDGSTSGAGSIDRFYDLDSEGKRVPVTFSNIPSFASITPYFGNGTMHDVSNLQVIYTAPSVGSSGVIAADKLPLYDVLFTDSQGHVVTTLPALTMRADVDGYDIAGAQMPSGATQTVTFSTFYTTIRVTVSVDQQEDTYLLTARLRANGAYVGAPLPGDLTLQWPGGATIVIPAGETEVQDIVSSNVAWQTFTATLDYWGADAFKIITTCAIDVTQSHWKGYALGTLNGHDLYDIQYVGTIPEGHTIYLTGDGFVAGTVITSGTDRIASHLMKMAAGASPTMDIRMDNTITGDEFTIEIGSVIIDQPVVLRYFQTYDDNNRTVAKLTDSNRYGITSRRTNIGEVLPYMRVRDGSQSSIVPIYNPASIAALSPTRTWTDAIVRTDFSEGMYDTSGIVEFTYTPTWGTNIISVGNNLPGLEVYPYWSNTPLPKA